MTKSDSDRTITINVPVEVTFHPDHVFPSFYEEAATFSDDAPIRKVGRSATHPFAYYLFSKEGVRPLFAATVNVGPAMVDLVNRWEEIAATENVEEASS